jgi:hypothetical protein
MADEIAMRPFEDDDDLLGEEQLVLSDLINRVLDKGVVISAHVRISIADIDLVELDLKLLISSVATLMRRTSTAPAIAPATASADLPVRIDRDA